MKSGLFNLFFKFVIFSKLLLQILLDLLRLHISPLDFEFERTILLHNFRRDERAISTFLFSKKPKICLLFVCVERVGLKLGFWFYEARFEVPLFLVDHFLIDYFALVCEVKQRIVANLKVRMADTPQITSCTSLGVRRLHNSCTLASFLMNFRSVALR